ncbi:VWA domain-containing protein, partial [Streptomonospora salina]
AVAATRPAPPADDDPAPGRPPAAKTRPVFDTPPAHETVITGTRAPTRGEQADARRLAQTLGRAAHREPVTTTTSAPTPPGRLRMRAVLARQAQQAAGALPTAEPFTRTHRRPNPRPPLRLGIACDVSGSMDAAVGPVASAAYICARACTHLPSGSATATVAFNHDVHAVTDPRRPPTRVTEFTATGFDEDLATATDALDHALGLARPGAARLLVIVSDGRFDEDRRARAQQRLDRLGAAGCALVWLAVATRPDALDGTEVTVLDQAQEHRLPQVVGRAAARALAAA